MSKFSFGTDKALVYLPLAYTLRASTSRESVLEFLHERREAARRDVIVRRGAVSPGEGIIPLREMPRFSIAYTYTGRVYRHW